jgi:hypothetical protein
MLMFMDMERVAEDRKLPPSEQHYNNKYLRDMLKYSKVGGNEALRHLKKAQCPESIESWAHRLDLCRINIAICKRFLPVK